MEKELLNLILASILTDLEALGTRTDNNIDISFKNYPDSDKIFEIFKSSSENVSSIENIPEAQLIKAAENITYHEKLPKITEEVIYEPVHSIFSHLNRDKKGDLDLFLKNNLGLGYRTSTADKKLLTKEDYQKVLNNLNSFFNEVTISEEYLNSIMNQLEEELSLIPAYPANEYNNDISLYSHIKLKVAILVCLYEYIKEKNLDINTFLENEETYLKENIFILFSADFSGIQDFIYTTRSKRALKTLRSRSFYLEFLMEDFIDELLEITGLSRFNMLYSGGGHCYLLLPNTTDVEEKIKEWTNKFNAWLQEKYDISLYLAYGYVQASPNELLNLPEGEMSYRNLFKRLSSEISKKKLQRYSAEEIRKLNSQDLSTTRECKICGHASKHLKDDICENCNLFVKLSNEILNKDTYIVTSNRLEPYSIPILGFNNENYLTLTTQKDLEKYLNNKNDIKRIYSKNRIEINYPKNITINIGDYMADGINDMEDFASNAQGIKRIAVCRMDVDNLGATFVSGFESNDDSSHNYVNIIRTSELSRNLSKFFKKHINEILEGSIIQEEPLKIAIVYSGGDDVFLVGSWFDVINAALRIRNELKNFSGEKLTISSGIGIFNSTYPIRSAANETLILEDSAKTNIDPNTGIEKDSIVLFSPEDTYTFNWDRYESNVINEKLDLIENMLSREDSQHHTAFIYNIVNYLRNLDDKPNIARYAYLLARLRPKNHDQVYENFIQTMYSWISDQKSIDELLTALYIYIYKNREQSHE